MRPAVVFFNLRAIVDQRVRTSHEECFCGMVYPPWFHQFNIPDHKIRAPNVDARGQRILCTFWDWRSNVSSNQILFTYRIKRTESPANSLLVLTNTLQPVVSKCLFGWPENFCFPDEKLATITTRHRYWYKCKERRNVQKFPRKGTCGWKSWVTCRIKKIKKCQHANN